MRIACAGFLLLMFACAPLPSAAVEEPSNGASGACDAGAAQSLLGQQGTAELASEAQRLSGAVALRWIGPGQLVTMDYRVDRLNIEVDANNKVVAIRCG